MLNRCSLMIHIWYEREMNGIDEKDMGSRTHAITPVLVAAYSRNISRMLWR